MRDSLPSICIALKNYQTAVEFLFCKGSIRILDTGAPFAVIVLLTCLILLRAHLPSDIQYGALLFANSISSLNPGQRSTKAKMRSSPERSATTTPATLPGAGPSSMLKMDEVVDMRPRNCGGVKMEIILQRLMDGLTEADIVRAVMSTAFFCCSAAIWLLSSWRPFSSYFSTQACQ